VKVFDAREELVGEHEDRLEPKLAPAEIEEVLERGAEQVQDHDVVVALGAVPADVGDAGWGGRKGVGARGAALVSSALPPPPSLRTSALKNLVQLGLVHELGVARPLPFLQGWREGVSAAAGDPARIGAAGRAFRLGPLCPLTSLMPTSSPVCRWVPGGRRGGDASAAAQRQGRGGGCRTAARVPVAARPPAAARAATDFRPTSGQRHGEPRRRTGPPPPPPRRPLPSLLTQVDVAEAAAPDLAPKAVTAAGEGVGAWAGGGGWWRRGGAANARDRPSLRPPTPEPTPPPRW